VGEPSRPKRRSSENRALGKSTGEDKTSSETEASCWEEEVVRRKVVEESSFQKEDERGEKSMCCTD